MFSRILTLQFHNIFFIFIEFELSNWNTFENSQGFIVFFAPVVLRIKIFRQIKWFLLRSKYIKKCLYNYFLSIKKNLWCSLIKFWKNRSFRIRVKHVTSMFKFLWNYMIDKRIFFDPRKKPAKRLKSSELRLRT